jgi:hypothetical protein
VIFIGSPIVEDKVLPFHQSLLPHVLYPSHHLKLLFLRSGIAMRCRTS